MLNLIKYLILNDTIEDNVEKNDINKYYMTNFNHYLYSCITEDNSYSNCEKNTSINYFENNNMIRFTTVYKNNQYQDNIYKQKILSILNKFIYLSQLNVNLNNINCYIIKNIGNNKDKINITIDITK